MTKMFNIVIIEFWHFSLQFYYILLHITVDLTAEYSLSVKMA